MVAEADTAFRVRSSNRGSIGIKHEFYPKGGIGFTEAQRQSSARLVCAIAAGTGSRSIDSTSSVTAKRRTRITRPRAGLGLGRLLRLVRSCAGTGTAQQTDDVPGSSLSIGARSSEVLRPQSALARLGYTQHVTGYFGPSTDAAVRRFQREHGVDTIGVYVRARVPRSSPRCAETIPLAPLC